MTGAQRAEILSSEILLSLGSVREDVERHVAKLDRYRALQAIEKTIADFPDLDDLTRGLSDLRDNIQLQLNETREVRALRAVEKIMPELTEVLAFLTERENDPKVDAEATGTAEPEVPLAPPVETGGAGEADLVEVIARPDEPAAPVMTVTGAEGTAKAVEHPALPEDNVAASAPAPQSEAGGAPSLAYNLAQMMVQAMVPPILQPPAPPPPDSANVETREPDELQATVARPAEPTAERAA